MIQNFFFLRQRSCVYTCERKRASNQIGEVVMKTELHLYAKNANIELAIAIELRPRRETFRFVGSFLVCPLSTKQPQWLCTPFRARLSEKALKNAMQMQGLVNTRASIERATKRGNASAFPHVAVQFQQFS